MAISPRSATHDSSLAFDGGNPGFDNVIDAR